jgi:hypothetical protein
LSVLSSNRAVCWRQRECVPSEVRQALTDSLWSFPSLFAETSNVDDSAISSLAWLSNEAAD